VSNSKTDNTPSKQSLGSPVNKDEVPSKEEDCIPLPTGDANLIDTDYVIGQDNVKKRFSFSLDIHGKVFSISALIIIFFVLLTLVFQHEVAPVFNLARAWLMHHLAWFFMSTANVFVLFCFALIVSPLGRVRLGGNEATPDYSYLGWFSMLFSAGMGIGLMFYGVAEPMLHFSAATGGAGDTITATRLGMAATIYHWGLHPWAIYSTVALALALFSFNKGLPLSLRSIFYPIFGERVWGWPGHIIDILAVFATLFGLATSLGLGAEQALAGLHLLFGFSVNNTNKVILISIISAVALVSVVAGLDLGVKILSQVNMGLALLLLLFVIIAGPTIAILSGFFTNLVAYVRYLPELSNPFHRADINFTQAWTAFYWAWWISWSPFVGMFIARVSRGRTVREFLIAVLLVPSLLSVIWMTAFGGTAIEQLIHGFMGVKDTALELKLFAMLSQLPLASISSFIGIILVVVFFVTSSDSGSLVIDTITAGGKVDSPVTQRIFWVIIQGLIAITLLLGGGLVALQSMALVTAVPFAFILLISCFSIVKGLLSEPR
ncbi:UNVERIFIED_CONTAM: hypothetical protein GTU68_035390, partial [Idotea baltica]|nr:hypothetical protein [Idotea baltica]